MRSIDQIISIHTPAKGVTTKNSGSGWIEKISIHTPAKGVTKKIVHFFNISVYFNPHSREGSDYKVP